jgi:uncharacterized protein
LPSELGNENAKAISQPLKRRVHVWGASAFLPTFFSLLLALLVISAGFPLFVRWLEPRVAFFPSRGETTTPADFGVAFDVATIDTADGEQVRAWWLHAPNARARVVYFHGNGGNLSVWAPILSDLARHGYEVMAFDYRGYGLSTGQPTERGLYRDVDAVLAHVSSSGSSPALPLAFWGRSLGTTLAAYAATRHRPDRVILEAGFPDARMLVGSSAPLAFLSLFSTYRFPTAELMRDVQAPVLVMHGTHDSVIPFELGRALYDRLGGAKTFVAIAGGDHNDVRPPDERAYWRAVETFIGPP